MKKNVGTIDKIIRFLIAAVAIFFAYKGGIETAWVGYLLYIVGAILLFTILTSSCPLYTITGKNSLKK